MRGEDRQQAHLFSYASPEPRVPADHPLRLIRVMADAALQQLSPLFEALYVRTGRPSVAPERLLRAPLPRVFHSVRGETLLMHEERIALGALLEFGGLKKVMLPSRAPAIERSQAD